MSALKMGVTDLGDFQVAIECTECGPVTTCLDQWTEMVVQAHFAHHGYDPENLVRTEAPDEPPHIDEK